MQAFKYNVDLALCIDATGSMSPIIDRVKNSALNFYSDLKREMDAASKKIDQLRVRVISFRDFDADGASTMGTSDFFALPQQSADFSAYVNGIQATGGGDEPENGLEAVALAMRSQWTREGDKRRHVIVVWSDVGTQGIEKESPAKQEQYPDLPKTFDALTDMWEGQSGPMDQNAKRLIIFAPDAYAWTDIANQWEQAIHHVAKGGEGLKDVDYKAVLDSITKSI